MLSSLALVMAIGLLTPNQGAVPNGRRFVLENQAELQFTVSTNVGPISGTLDVVRLDTRGIEGWGRFEMRMSVDPASVQTGDLLRDVYIAQQILGANLVSFASTDRVSPRFRTGAGKVPQDEMFSAIAWMDNRRRHRRLELFYQWVPNGDGGVLKIEHTAEWKNFGFSKVHHPFIQITGPMVLKLSAKLVRAR